MMALVLAILATCLGVVQATYGVDISQPCSSSGFTCLKANGNDFAIVRVFMSTGKVDPNGASSISAAWAGGMAHVDGYIFPCFSCGNPAGQMDAAINGLTAAGLKQVRRLMGTNDTTDFKTEELGSSYGMLWLDIEGGQYWSTDMQANINFIQAMADEGTRRGVHLGVYTSKSQWSVICGSSKILGNLPLWYAHYQSPPDPSYSDFVPFGGWSKPAIKQYQGTHTLCGCGIDSNSY